MGQPQSTQNPGNPNQNRSVPPTTTAQNSGNRIQTQSAPPPSKPKSFEAIPDKYRSLDEVQAALRKSGLESCNRNQCSMNFLFNPVFFYGQLFWELIIQNPMNGLVKKVSVECVCMH